MKKDLLRIGDDDERMQIHNSPMHDDSVVFARRVNDPQCLSPVTKLPNED
jgi:hypothetical protein